MASPDLSVFDRLKSKRDFDRENQMIELERQKAQQAMSSQDPSAVREWQYFNSLPQQDQARYLQMKRAEQVLNLGGEMAVRNPLGGIGETYTVTPKISETPEFEGTVSAAKKTAEIKAEDLAKAQTGIGSMNEQSKQILDVIGGIEQSPGLSAVVGLPNPLKGGLGLFNVRGTPAADFQAKLDQLGGKQFLQAFESLKGGGAITQIEGEKATNAIARMQVSQSEEEFRKSLDEFKGIVLRAQERANQKVQKDPMLNWLDAARIRNDELGGGNPYSDLPPAPDVPAFGMTPNVMQESPVSPKLNKMQESEAVFNAKKAIRNGANADAVKQRLIDNGIDPKKAGL